MLHNEKLQTDSIDSLSKRGRPHYKKTTLPFSRSIAAYPGRDMDAAWNRVSRGSCKKKGRSSNCVQLANCAMRALRSMPAHLGLVEWLLELHLALLFSGEGANSWLDLLESDVFAQAAPGLAFIRHVHTDKVVDEFSCVDRGVGLAGG